MNTTRNTAKASTKTYTRIPAAAIAHPLSRDHVMNWIAAAKLKNDSRTVKNLYGVDFISSDDGSLHFIIDSYKHFVISAPDADGMVTYEDSVMTLEKAVKLVLRDLIQNQSSTEYIWNAVNASLVRKNKIKGTTKKDKEHIKKIKTMTPWREAEVTKKQLFILGNRCAAYAPEVTLKDLENLARGEASDLIAQFLAYEHEMSEAYPEKTAAAAPETAPEAVMAEKPTV